MATAKSATLTFRIEPALKDALCVATEQEHRSIANMVEGMIRTHCERTGVPIVEQDAKVNTPRKLLKRSNN